MIRTQRPSGAGVFYDCCPRSAKTQMAKPNWTWRTRKSSDQSRTQQNWSLVDSLVFVYTTLSSTSFFWMGGDLKSLFPFDNSRFPDILLMETTSSLRRLYSGYAGCFRRHVLTSEKMLKIEIRSCKNCLLAM